MNDNQTFIKTGDWIRGKLKSGEMIYGYIEGIEASNGVVKVKVVHCDNPHIAGRTIGVLSKWVEKTAMSKAISKEQLQQIIDLALLTNDKEWFLELTNQLKADSPAVMEKDKKAKESDKNSYFFK
ncbi:IDEAL domain-containing protein [Metabacillus sp. GX 13764]|uniref:IDEAL domain-containing protein n=1 Tax=Metabacillus kandeliae TaxID=2900151 RepID=UPI001E3FB0C0|nr:IDEAL domain-containing protein [Metabacillus kandeliae]MCD7033584.1 IDEAL domain-containing protein [Metabacillus kandeliae]